MGFSPTLSPLTPPPNVVERRTISQYFTIYCAYRPKYTPRYRFWKRWGKVGDFFHPPRVCLHLRHKSRHSIIDFKAKRPYSLTLGVKGGESGRPTKGSAGGRGLLETPAPLFGFQGSVLGHSCTHCFMPLNTIRFADLAETAPRASLAKPNHPTDNTKPASSIALFSFLYVNRRRARQPRAASKPPQRPKNKKLA